MELLTITIIIAICITYRIFARAKYSSWFILILSVLGLFYYQPVSPIKNYDFWVPAISLSICIIVWVLVVEPSYLQNKYSKTTYFLTFGLFIGFIVIRFLPQRKILKYFSLPNQAEILIFSLLIASTIYVLQKLKNKNRFLIPIVLILLSIFIVLKNDFLSYKLSQLLRGLNNQSLELSKSNEIIWIGYSYFAFRLIHVIIDTRNRGKIEMELHEFIGYLLFLPTILAGPIMRREDYQKALHEIDTKWQDTIYPSFKRITAGLFQKFILADTLSLISMRESLVKDISSTGWMWFVVILYSFRIYFDFNGYTHIAIGIAGLLGINLPENFNKPLKSPNITIFWNNWHITLTQWFRSYYFNPVTRFFRRKFRQLNPNYILAFMQISTMILIGLWHGISWNFILWGAWIGVGLFIQNKLTTSYIKQSSTHKAFWQSHPINHTLSILLTFIFISLGWVWFAMPDLNTSLYIFKTLFGLG